MRRLPRKAMAAFDRRDPGALNLRAQARTPGVTLCGRGDPADTFYLLVEGMVELRARPPGRRAYRTVELIGPSCTFGDEALLGEHQYLASARVVKSTRSLALSRPAFEM